MKRKQNADDAGFVSEEEEEDEYRLPSAEDAFMTNPVASATDRTGFSVLVPQTDFEAVEISRMNGSIPLTSHRGSQVVHDSKHTRDKDKH